MRELAEGGHFEPFERRAGLPQEARQVDSANEGYASRSLRRKGSMFSMNCYSRGEPACRKKHAN